MPPGSYPIQITGATAQNYQLTLVDGVLTVKPSPAVKSENLQGQVTEMPRTTLTYASVTQPIASAPLPPAGNSGMGPAGSMTVLGGGVAGEAGTGGLAGPVIEGLAAPAVPLPAASPTPSPAGVPDSPLPPAIVGNASAATLPNTAPTGVTGGGASPRLAVVLPLLQIQGSELRTGLAVGRLFSLPAGMLVTYSAKLANGQPLPGWLRFDPQSGRLEGSPPSGASDVDVQIVAQTSDGQSATARIRVNVPRARR